MTKDHIIPRYSLYKPYQVIIVPTEEEREEDWPKELGKWQAWFTEETVIRKMRGQEDANSTKVNGTSPWDKKRQPSV